MQDTSVIATIVTELLEQSGPELGARLKQRLIAAFGAKGLGRFDERTYGFVRFKEFLAKALADCVAIEQTSVGDFTVALKAAVSAPQGAQAKAGNGASLQGVRGEIWQAFTNPDVRRRRFVRRKDGMLEHFMTNAAASQRAAQLEADGFVEVTPIAPDTQKGWMREFVESLRVPAEQAQLFMSFIEKPYSSSLNVAFGNVLGAHGAAWRKFRKRRVIAEIVVWARPHDFDVTVFQAASPVGSSDAPGTPPVRAVSAVSASLSPREEAVRLLDLLGDEDITSVVIPTLLTSLLIRARTRS